MQGYIKLFRKFTEWEWYNNINVKILFLHLLLIANHKEKQWQGITIKEGQLLTSIEHLASETGLTVQQTRTALTKLKSTNEITSKSTNKYTLITLVNWGKYQLDKEKITNEITNNLTNEQQTNNKQITTNNNDKNVKNNNYIIIVEQVIDYMNELANTKFKSTTAKTKSLIKARLKEGFTIDDLKDVVYYKYHEWYKKPFEFKNGVSSDTYFRPNTLFGTKFEEYLQQYNKNVPEVIK